MGTKEIQEQRMKEYFIHATKDILKGEGLKSISVRNIAERAGYSYATLYNYFKDIKDLIFECVVDFQEECEEFIYKETKKTPAGAEKIKAISKAYIKYFIQYPGIFELFFLERTSDFSGKKKTSELVYNFYDKVCEEEWNNCIKNKILKEDEANQKKTVLKNTIAGLLLFYNNRTQPKTYKAFSEMTDAQIDFIIKK
ncbi:MAG: TetR/AcrR family transcriptional regulator [Melioribacteraceae bacterium]|nr:TetR/AcrR family transcriptional regulator [Melioribacteraceae bacterium]